MKTYFIKISDIFGNECITQESGIKLYNLIKDTYLNHLKLVEISFKDVNLITVSFLNAAFGNLYNGEFTDYIINKYLIIKDMQPVDFTLLKKIISNTKLFYLNPEKFIKSIDEILEN